LPWSGAFPDTEGIAFSGRKKSFYSESMFSSAKFLINLEESHFKAAKTPNRDGIDASYLWVEGHMTLEESHSQATKLIKRLSSKLLYL
jgi:hypothetical protein